MIPLRGHVRERAMAGGRPYVRPLLLAHQHYAATVAALTEATNELSEQLPPVWPRSASTLV
jgi:hypothetical protein